MLLLFRHFRFSRYKLIDVTFHVSCFFIFPASCCFRQKVEADSDFFLSACFFDFFSPLACRQRLLSPLFFAAAFFAFARALPVFLRCLRAALPLAKVGCQDSCFSRLAFGRWLIFPQPST